jgi:hypothetical protein
MRYSLAVLARRAAPPQFSTRAPQFVSPAEHAGARN